MILAKPKPIKVKKVKKPRRKSSRQLLERELDRLVRSIVLLRDGCCVCPSPEHGHSEVRQPGHLITRQKRGLRWSLVNVHEQCSSCNLLHNHHPQRYTNWFVKTFGAGEYTKLVEESEEMCRLTVDDLLELRSQLLDIYSKQVAEKGWKPRFSQREILSGEWKEKK